MRLLVTGGAGFIGSNFVRHMLAEHPGYRLVVADSLTYAGSLSNLEPALSSGAIEFECVDICQPEIVEVARGCDAIINFAAESHVDRSIESAAVFVRTNVQGTHRLLEVCRAGAAGRLLQVSTDEVYGSLGDTGRFRETTPLAPTSPYAATKAAADMLALAFAKTYGLPVVVTRSSNNYGPHQFPEKFIPLMITRALAGEKLPVYGDGAHVRDWIHVSDHCRAIDVVLHRGKDGETYNIGADSELQNLEVAQRILRLLGRSPGLIGFVADRPAHDRRYAIDASKVRELGWQPKWDFEGGLRQTIAWYQENQAWIEDIRTGHYREYISRHYENREVMLRELRGHASNR